MNRGRIEQIGTPREIYEQPRTLFVGKFVGESTTLPLERVGSGLHLFGRQLLSRNAPADGTACELLIRPERLRLNGDPQSANIVRASYRSSVYQGDSVLLQFLAQGSHEISLKVAASEPWLQSDHQPGEEVDLYLAPDDTVVVTAS
jgi:putative spermidine/putrescine transport system ATP-binding protein